MENEIDNLYPSNNNNEFFENEDESEQPQEKDYYAEIPPNFHYTPIEVPHKVDLFVIILSWIIIGVFCYVLFATTNVFE